MVDLAVGARLIDDAGRLLLVRRRRPPDQGAWSLPGGRVEPWETPEDAIERELREELGVESTIDGYRGCFWYRVDERRRLSLLYDVRFSGRVLNVADEEHAAVEWFSMDALPEPLAAPAAFATARRASEGRAYGARVPMDAQVLLIQPFFPLADGEALSIPIGLASLAAVLRRDGISVAVLDCCLPGDYLLFAQGHVVRASRVVGVQFHSAMSYDFAVRACRRVRRLNPGALLVGGGELATARRHDLLREAVVDVVVREEGEETGRELISWVLSRTSVTPVDDLPQIAGISFLRAGRIVDALDRPLIRDLDVLPLPSIDDFRWRDYGQWTIFTSRGCPFRCTYCSSAAFWRHRVRYHSVGRVVDEIARMASYGAGSVYIADDTFTLDPRRVRSLCEELIRSGTEVVWSCLTRVDRVDEALLATMAEAGCREISFGLETAVPRTLELARKGATVEDARAALRACRRAGIRSRVSVIIGLPGEIAADVRSTIELVLAERPNEVMLYALTPHEGTVMYGQLEQLGVRILVDEPVLWSRNVLDPVCETATLPRDVIIALGREFIDRLVEAGYVYLSDEMPVKRVGASHTVATSFAPVQGLTGAGPPI